MSHQDTLFILRVAAVHALYLVLLIVPHVVARRRGDYAFSFWWVISVLIMGLSIVICIGLSSILN